MRARAQSVLYYADDKDILDLLESSKQKLTATVLRDFLRLRGILVSDQEPREDLARYIATLFVDWPDLRSLLEHTETNPRSERVTFARAETDATPDEVLAALEAVKTSRSATGTESLIIIRPADGVYELKYAYSELDASKTRLAQRRTKEGTLLVSRQDRGYSLRHEANSQLQVLADEFLAQLAPSNEDAAPPEVRPISLANVTTTEARTAFFTGMMRRLDGMLLADVTQASVQRADAVAGSDDAESQTEDELVGAEDTDVDGTSNEASGLGDAAIGMVKAMVLRGDTVLASGEYAAIRDHFYVSGVVWESEEQQPNGVRVLFEARFDNEVDCTEFSYQVRGVYPRSQRNDGQLRKAHRACTPDEQRHYQAVLERAAEESLAAILAESEGTVAPGGG